MDLDNGVPGPFAKLRATRCAQPIIVCPVACEAAARPHGPLTLVTLLHRRAAALAAGRGAGRPRRRLRAAR